MKLDPYHHCYYLTYKGGMRKQHSMKHIIPIYRIISKIVCVQSIVSTVLWNNLSSQH
jgi:hypothetical protein